MESGGMRFSCQPVKSVNELKDQLVTFLVSNLCYMPVLQPLSIYLAFDAALSPL